MESLTITTQSYLHAQKFVEVLQECKQDAENIQVKHRNRGRPRAVDCRPYPNEHLQKEYQYWKNAAECGKQIELFVYELDEHDLFHCKCGYKSDSKKGCKAHLERLKGTTVSSDINKYFDVEHCFRDVLL